MQIQQEMRQQQQQQQQQQNSLMCQPIVCEQPLITMEMLTVLSW
jgi:hypothetical protein